MKRNNKLHLKQIHVAIVLNFILSMPAFGAGKPNSTSKMDSFKAAGAPFSADMVNSTFKGMNPQALLPSVTSATVKKCQQVLAIKGSLDERLRTNDCAFLARQIIWEAGDGRRYPYLDWSVQQKNRLNEIFQKMVRGEDLVLNCPRNLAHRFRGSRNYNDSSPNSWIQGDLFLTADEAFEMYVVKVAHALYLEAERIVPWTILNRPETELRELLASFRHHDLINHSAYSASTLPEGIQESRDFVSPFRTGYGPDTLNCDPRIGYKFLRGINSTSRQNLMGATEIETLANITAWFSENVGHGSREMSTRNSVAFQAYLENRLLSEGGIIIVTNGCHSASHLFYDLAKSVNIPLLTVMTRGSEFNADGSNPDLPGSSHGGLVYGWGGPNPLILHHVDDIYANELAPFLPVGRDGRLLSAAGAVMQFFEFTWVRPEVLIHQGFHLATNFPEVNAQSSFFGSGREGYFNYSSHVNIGNFLGSWPNRNDQGLGRLYEQYYELCSKRMIDRFCATGSHGFGIYDEFFAHRIDASEYNTYSSMQFFDRATTCVNSYGGCSAAASYFSQWQNNRGRTVRQSIGAVATPPVMKIPSSAFFNKETGLRK